MATRNEAATIGTGNASRNAPLINDARSGTVTADFTIAQEGWTPWVIC